ncbi:MAG: hypothetical protein E4H26_10100 [Flavobacteriales bacterium]|nr:MAG: hypothetical protein E4H26_10100 [Flavobacteriales bacterium]
MAPKIFSAHYFLPFIMLLVPPPMLFAQDPYLQKANRKIMGDAMRITKAYRPRLVMSADQALQFRGKVAEFLMHREWVEENLDLTPTEKYKLLKRISSRETSERADVLEAYR